MGMFKLELTYEDAKSSHQSFYDDDFEVMPMKRRGFWDIFPLNILIAYVDLPGGGEWDGIISTNGKKIVITQSKWANAANHKKTFEFNLDDIDTLTDNYVNLSILFKNNVKGLTMAKVNYFIKYPIFFGTFGVAFLLTSILFKGKLLNIRLKNDFDNLENFISKLNP